PPTREGRPPGRQGRAADVVRRVAIAGVDLFTWYEPFDLDRTRVRGPQPISPGVLWSLPLVPLPLVWRRPHHEAAGRNHQVEELAEDQMPWLAPGKQKTSQVF